MWAIFAAPLLMSVDLRTIKPDYKVGFIYFNHTKRNLEKVANIILNDKRFTYFTEKSQHTKKNSPTFE